MNQPHVEPLPITLIKEKHDGKSYTDFLKLKLRRDPKFSTSDLYEFKICLFDNVNPKEFFMFVRNFNMALAESVMLEADAKFQYLRTLFHREALRQFDSLSSYVEST